jgi:YD repeat-containing protein
MVIVNNYQVCENTYNTAVASLVAQYNTALANYHSCYASTEASLSPSNKAIALMQDKNMIDPKIKVSTTVNGNLTAIDSTTYQVTDIAQNIIRPQQVNIQVANKPMEARANFYAYDNSGNLLEQSQTSGPHASYQWGYNKTYPVAQATNAKNNDIFYDSFEEGDGNSTSGLAKTGHYSHSGAYSQVLTGLDAGSYTLSYWSQSPTTGIWSLTTVPETITGTTFTISLSGQIDDVRFCPALAQMTTYTYDPQIGMTSSTDAKNQTTYYEYDGLQRLMNIKDQYGNILKHMDYHYQGQ